MNYYEHHLGDYAAATAHLTWDEDMAYTRLMRHYYHTERGIPDGQQYRLARAESPAQRAAVDVVLGEFFELADGFWLQARCEQELARYRDKQAKAQRSANSRWQKEREPAKPATEAVRIDSTAAPDANAMLPSDANAMRTQCERNAHQTPDTNLSPSLRSGDSARARSATRLPPEWRPPDDDLRFALDLVGEGAVRLELAKFRDYWAAKAGRDGAKLDWPATWRNWIRRAHETRSRSSHQGTRRLSAVERVRLACNLDADGFPLGPDDGDLRPPLGEQLWVDADGDLVSSPLRLVEGRA